MMAHRVLSMTVVAVAFLSFNFSSTPGLAQERSGTVQACGSEQSLRQLLASSGRIGAEDCSSLRISSLMSEGERLCLIDLTPGDSGALERLREAARSSRYWVRCADLAAAAMNKP